MNISHIKGCGDMMTEINAKEKIKREKDTIYADYGKKIEKIEKRIKELESSSNLNSIVAELKARYKKGILEDLEDFRSGGFAYLERNKWKPCFNFQDEYDEFMLEYLQRKNSIDYDMRQYEDVAWQKAWRQVEDLQKPLRREVERLESESQQKAFDKETEYINKFYDIYPNLHPDKLEIINKYELKIKPLTWSVNEYYYDLEEQEERELKKKLKDFLDKHQKLVDKARFLCLKGQAWEGLSIYKNLPKNQWTTLLKTTHLSIDVFICTRGGAPQYKIELKGAQLYFTDIQNYPSYSNKNKELLKAINEGIGIILERNKRVNDIYSQYLGLGKFLNQERQKILKKRKDRLNGALVLFK